MRSTSYKTGLALLVELNQQNRHQAVTPTVSKVKVELDIQRVMPVILIRKTGDKRDGPQGLVFFSLELYFDRV